MDQPVQLTDHLAGLQHVDAGEVLRPEPLQEQRAPTGIRLPELDGTMASPQLQGHRLAEAVVVEEADLQHPGTAVVGEDRQDESRPPVRGQAVVGQGPLVGELVGQTWEGTEVCGEVVVRGRLLGEAGRDVVRELHEPRLPQVTPG